MSLEDLPGHLPQLDGGLLLDQAHRPLLHQPLGVALLLKHNVPKLHRLKCLSVLGEILQEKCLNIDFPYDEDLYLVDEHEAHSSASFKIGSQVVVETFVVQRD